MKPHQRRIYTIEEYHPDRYTSWVLAIHEGEYGELISTLSEAKDKLDEYKSRMAETRSDGWKYRIAYYEYKGYEKPYSPGSGEE